MQGYFKNRKKIERDRRKFVQRDALKNRNRERTWNNKKESKKIHLKHKRCKDALEVEKKKERKVSTRWKRSKKSTRDALKIRKKIEREVRIIKKNRIEKNFGEKYGRKFVWAIRNKLEMEKK